MSCLATENIPRILYTIYLYLYSRLYKKLIFYFYIKGQFEYFNATLILYHRYNIFCDLLAVLYVHINVTSKIEGIKSKRA